VPRKNTTLLDDGQHAGDESPSVHWDLARTVLGLVTTPASDETVRLWYQAMSAYTVQTRQWNLAMPMLDHGLSRLPDDARLLLHAGVMHETFGSANVQNAVGMLKAGGDTSLTVGTREGELVVAERFFRRATVADPTLAEASLRLGHVLAQFGNHDQATGELQRAAAGTTDPTLIYYAMLLLAREEAANGRAPAAYAALEKAGALFPQAQSPLLAECQLARREDDFARVTAALQKLERLPPGVDGRHDPWWVYEIYAGRDADALIAAFYASYRKGDPR
jgi:tetratricopeptide (TPR) repeat protein